ncbi:MAG: hypothetical protein GX957_12985 [Clostridiaceae bacterium]|nr:hypothetical protein [Clostridiaceae bacterium]
MKRLFVVAMLFIALTLAGCTQGDNGNGNKETGGNDKIELHSIDLVEKGILLTGYNNDLKLSPDGKTVAFSGHYYDYDKHVVDEKLVVADLVTGDTNIFEGINGVMGWHKDGTKILYLGDSEIGLMDIKTGEKKVIEEVWTYATLSPDGGKVAYTVRGQIYPWDQNARPESEAGLWIYDLATGNKKQLTNNSDESYPVWYPDSKKIFYFCDLGVELGEGAGHMQGMAAISVDGGEQEVFPQKEGKFRRAEWIVPGKSMFVLGGWDDGTTYNILDLENESFVNIGDDSSIVSQDFVTVDKKSGLVLKSGFGVVEFYDTLGNKVIEFNVNGEDAQNFKYTVSPVDNLLAFVYGDYERGNVDDSRGNEVRLVTMDGENTRHLSGETGDDGVIYNESILWDAQGKNIIALQAEVFDGIDRITTIRVLPVK